MFSDVLLTVDFDRTLTGPDGQIPRRNLDAIEHFMKNGGKFTVNTGRSGATFWMHLDTLPHNAPWLLYNGSAAYEDGKLIDCKPLDMDVEETMRKMIELFPDMNLEIQGTKVHYLVNATPEMDEVYKNLNWRYTREPYDEEPGKFMKFALFGQPRKPEMSTFYDITEEEERRFVEAEQLLHRLYPGKIETFRAAPRIIDVHAKGVSKCAAAQDLKKRLGRKILVCVGDAENDIAMLHGADHAFCPSDGVIARQFPNVCPCGKGAVADVIYYEIPKILGIQP